jgi:hypothetical protein
MSDKKDSSKSPRDTNGPVVKTGPTAGQNRSRNNDGSWRKKRSDSGESKKKSGCFLSTAACHFKGLPDDCHELESLRKFRDSHLLSSSEGQAMVAHYYSVAPAIAERLTDPADLEQVWQVICRCVVAIHAGHHEHATVTYRAMVKSLEHKLLGAAA